MATVEEMAAAIEAAKRNVRAGSSRPVSQIHALSAALDYILAAEAKLAERDAQIESLKGRIASLESAREYDAADVRERDAQIAEMWAQLCRAAGALAGPGGYTVGEFDTPSTVADHLIDAIGNLRNVLEDEEAMPPWRISFSDLIALQLLTHDKSVEYADYIERIAMSRNEIAIAVKVADISDNVENRQRIDFDEAPESRKAREKRYRRALARLLGTKEMGLG